MPQAPLDYRSPYDKPLKHKKPRQPRRFTISTFRMVYWIVMLTLIGLVLLYIRKHTIVQWDQLMQPPHGK